MKLFYLLALPILLSGQQRQPVTSVQPDCMVFFNIPTASSGAQAAVNSTGTSVVIDNHQAGCYGWTVAYTNHGFSAVTLTLQSAPDNAAGTAPGTWATVAVCGGSECLGINPNTAITSAITTTKAIAPWFRMNLTAKTGTGAVVGVLYAFKINIVANGGTPIIPSTCPGGSPTELQYNLAGACAGIPNSSWDGLNLNIKDSGNTGNIFTFSTDLVNGDPDCGALFFINCDAPLAPSVSVGNGTPGIYVEIDAIGGGDTTAASGTAGPGGNVVYRGGNGGAGSGITAATGGAAGTARSVGGQGGAASGLGINVGGAGGNAVRIAGFGGNATLGTSNTGGDAGIIQDTLNSGGLGSTANGLDGYVVVNGSALLGNRPDHIVEKWLTPNSGAIPSVRDSGAWGNATVTFAQLTTLAATAVNFDQLGCSNCQVTSGIDNTCATGGTGAMAFRINGTWKCGQ